MGCIIGVIYRDNGKENGNYYIRIGSVLRLWFRAWGCRDKV